MLGRSSRFWYAASLWCIGLFAVGHLAGFLGAAFAARNAAELQAVTAAMRGYRVPPILGISPSLLDLREYFSLAFSVLLLLVLSLCTAIYRSAAGPQVTPTLLTHSARVCAVGFACLGVASAYFHVPQGLISCGVIAVTFVAASRPMSLPIP